MCRRPDEEQVAVLALQAATTKPTPGLLYLLVTKERDDFIDGYKTLMV